MTMLDQTYLEIRSRICNAFLVWFSILAIPALAISLYRAVDIGWQPVMTMQIFLATAIWLTALYRKRLPYQVRAGSILSLMVVVGLTGVWSFGLVAGSITWLLVAPILGTVFFGLNTGLAILAGAVLVTSANGIATVIGIRPPAIDLVTYVTSASAWINMEIALVMTSGGTIIAIGILNRYFIESLETSRRQREKLEEGQREYRNILDNMVDTFYRTDQEGRLVMVSPSVVDIGGYSPEELIGKELSQFYVNKNKRAEFLKRIEEGGGKVSEFDAEVHKKGGGTVWASTSAHYWKDVGGNILGTEGTIRNITATRLAREALIRSRKMEAVGQLTGGIAHDYNNMLGVIIGNIQMVEKAAKFDDKSKQRLDKALAAAQRNAELTTKLLGFSRAQPLGTTLIFANDCISGLEDIIAKSLTASIEVKTHLSKDLWLVDVDPAELEDTILNLAINARDAMPSGGILAVDTANKVLDEGYVSYNPESHVGDYVVITMSDTGVGMLTEVREKIFDPFFSTKETGKGTGLGLSMVYAFVQRSGGFIKVYSEPGEGTSFRIFLPRVTDQAERSLIPDNIADREPTRGSETILVVDDEEFLVDLAVTQLEALGYRTLSADNGETALEILKADPDIDLLFTDITMPGKLDGYDLALAARQIHPALKILLTSGFAKQRENLKNGGNEILTRLIANLLSKPYMLTELATAVRRSLDESD